MKSNVYNHCRDFKTCLNWGLLQVCSWADQSEGVNLSYDAMTCGNYFFFNFTSYLVDSLVTMLQQQQQQKALIYLPSPGTTQVAFSTQSAFSHCLKHQLNNGPNYSYNLHLLFL